MAERADASQDEHVEEAEAEEPSDLLRAVHYLAVLGHGYLAFISFFFCDVLILYPCLVSTSYPKLNSLIDNEFY